MRESLTPSLLMLALLAAGCLTGAPEPSGVDAPPAPCPDAPDLCAEVCLESPAGAVGECGWTWGEPVCVCAPSPCDADACYAGERARRVCGTSPEGEPVEACVAP